MSYNNNLFLTEVVGVLPEIFLVLCCLGELMISLFTSTNKIFYTLEAQSVIQRIIFYFLVAIAIMLFYPVYNSFAITGNIFFAGAFQLNTALVHTKIAISCFTIFILIISAPYLKQLQSNNYEFGALIGLTAVAMFFVISAYNLVVLYLALELQALLLFILMSWHRHSRWSLEATLKYVLVNLLSSIFFLLAINRCFSVVGSVSYVAIANYYVPLLHSLLPEARNVLLLYPEEYPNIIYNYIGFQSISQTGWGLALTFLLIAFSLKLGVAPFHLWVPDIYANGPIPVVGFLATASKVSYVSALAILLGYVFYPILAYWQWFFGLSALISVGLGNLGLYKQTQLMRIVGISSIASGGYLYLIFGFAPSIYLYPLAVGYMILSAFLNCNLLMLTSTTFLTYSKDIKETNSLIQHVNDLAALRYSSTHKFWVFALALNLCSFAGIPPLLGFWGKFLTYTTIMHSMHGSSLVIIYLFCLMILTLIGAAMYLRMLSVLLFEEPLEIISYTVSDKRFHAINFFLFFINAFFIIYFSAEEIFLHFTPYYSSSVGFFWL